MENNFKTMNTLFLSVIDKEEEKRFKEEWESSEWLRKKIVSVLEKKVEATSKDINSKEIYKIFNWKDYLADSLGYQRMGKEIISLLNK